MLYGIFISLLALARKHPEVLAAHWFRLMTRLIGLRIHAHGVAADAPVLLVGNHISWLDILVIGSHAHTLFVSKAEVKGWPVVSLMTRAGKTLYIERGAHGTADLRAQMRERFDVGHRVLIFPEGTTTDGLATRRFQPRLFAIAIEHEIPVQVFALHYRHASAAYIDDLSLFDVLWSCTAERAIDVHLRFGPLLKHCERRDDYARSAQEWASAELEAFHRSHPRYAS